VRSSFAQSPVCADAGSKNKAESFFASRFVRNSLKVKEKRGRFVSLTVVERNLRVPHVVQ
jgi:hypothetical protein